MSKSKKIEVEEIIKIINENKGGSDLLSYETEAIAQVIYDKIYREEL